MAEEKAQDSAAESSSPAQPGQKPTLFIIMALFNMIAVLGVGVMLYMNRASQKSKATIDQVIQGEKKAQEADANKEPEFIGKVIPLETFVVNLSGSRGNKISKISMELEVDNIDVHGEIEKRKPQIRDIVIILLTSKTYEQISTRDGKDNLRDEIRDTINSFLTKGHIKRVYFTEFLFN